MERWLEIEGFAGRYEVSDMGNVRSLWCSRGWRTTPRVLRPSGKRYLHVVMIHPEGWRATRTIHSLVLGSFRGPCPSGQEARHIDGVRSNNVLGNLAWGTHEENVADWYVHGTAPVGASNPNAKLSESDVRSIRASGDSTTTLARVYGVTATTIRSIRKGETWRGLIFPSKGHRTPGRGEARS